MAFILLIKSLSAALWPAGIRLAMPGIADGERQRMNEYDQRIAEQSPKNQSIKAAISVTS